MIGPDYVETVTLDHLRARVGDEVDAVQTALGYPPEGETPAEQTVEIPVAGAYHGGGPRSVGVDVYPAVFVEVRDTVRVRLDEPGGPDAHARYTTRYRVRVYVYARGGTHEVTRRRRNRLTIAVRRVLIGRPSLDTPDGPGAATVDVDSARESYSAVDADGSGSSLAAAYVEVEIDVDERLDYGGDLTERTDLSVDLLDHPAL